MINLSSVKEGFRIKVRGWESPRKLVEIIARGNGWIAGMFEGSDGELEYEVVENWRVEKIFQGRKTWW